MVEAEQLRDVLRARGADAAMSLIAALGFERMSLPVPRSGFADFGLDPRDELTLEVAARHRGFHVLRIGFDGGLDPGRIQKTAAALHRHNPTRRALLVFESRADRRLVLASWGLSAGRFRLRRLWIDPADPSPATLDILTGLAVDGARTASDLALAHARALDREAVTRRFFVEFREQRARLAAALRGLPADAAAEERLELALILLTRLLFLYFVQRKGWLGGDTAYVRHIYQAALREGIPFYRRRLKPLFFGALNRPAGRRGAPARELGELPYLNGGLFERHPLERAHVRLDVPDEAFAPVFDELLDRYQFTLREESAAESDVAIDPEMLGKCFEGLMASTVRGATGAFFTPRELVEQVVDDALVAFLTEVCGCQDTLVRQLLDGDAPDLDAETRATLAESLRALRLLDPAVGSGAFLLTALHRIEAALDAVEDPPSTPLERFRRREDIIRRNLYGVDVNGAAVHLCELRLWLALVVELDVTDVADVPPLPNLDINIRQGDSLLDPIDFLFDLADAGQADLTAQWHRRLRRLAERRDRYFHAAGPTKGRLGRSLRGAERDLALGFLSQLLERIDARRRDLRLAAAGRDLFGKRSGLNAGQKRAAAALKRRRREARALSRRIEENDELPFFSYPVHFAAPGAHGHRFDVIVGNPPWVRTHEWAGISRRRLKQRFRSLRDAGWAAGGRLAGAGRGFGAQLDLSALFLERALDLLRPGGAVGFLLPAKLARGLSAAGLRRRLIGATRIVRIEDLAAAREQPFDATTYPMVLLAVDRPPEAGDNEESRHVVPIRSHDRHGDVLSFALPQRALPLLADDPASPWALAPPAVRSVMVRMREAGPPLGACLDARPCRGLFTGANALFVAEVPNVARTPVTAPDSDCVDVRVGGGDERLEASCLRPALRGEDLGAWRYRIGAALLWPYDDAGVIRATLPPATAAYMRRHRRALKARIGLRPEQPYWSLFRVRPDKWSLRVAWRDIAAEPGAAVIPARIEFLGQCAPVISLNTVYQVPTDSDEDAHLLAAILNSSIARAYLKVIAERASGGYFRFLGWTVGSLPFPTAPGHEARARCVAISRAAHRAGGLGNGERDRLDRAVAELYGLRPAELAELQRFDAHFSNSDGDG